MAAATAVSAPSFSITLSPSHSHVIVLNPAVKALSSFAILVLKHLDVKNFPVAVSTFKAVAPKEHAALQPVAALISDSEIAAVAKMLFFGQDEIDKLAASKELKSTIEDNFNDFMSYANIFKLYRENDAGRLVVKATNIETSLTTFDLINIIEAVYQQAVRHQAHPQISNTDIATDGGLYADNGIRCILKKERGIVHILLTDSPIVIAEKIGEGTFGTVYRTFNFTIGVFEAIKLAKKDKEANVIKEGYYLRKLDRQDSNYIQDRPTVIFDFTLNDERCAGFSGKFYSQSIETWLVNPDQSNQARLMACLELIENFEHLHDTMKIYHRDLKPNNVLMDDVDGFLKIILSDFGLVLSDGSGLTEPCVNYACYEDFLAYHHLSNLVQFEKIKAENINRQRDQKQSAAQVDTKMAAADGAKEKAAHQELVGLIKQHYARLEVYTLGVTIYQILCGAAIFPYNVEDVKNADAIKRFPNKTSVFQCHPLQCKGYSAHIIKYVQWACHPAPKLRFNMKQLRQGFLFELDPLAKFE